MHLSSHIRMRLNINVLFNVLKESYVMYEYYGDVMFEIAKAQAEEKNAQNFQLDRAIETLKKSLAFIKDGHFSIGPITTDSNEHIYNYAIRYDMFKGIPCIDCKKFYYDTSEEKRQLEEFVSKGMDYQNLEQFILDFRDNSGGSSEYICFS